MEFTVCVSVCVCNTKIYSLSPYILFILTRKDQWRCKMSQSKIHHPHTDLGIIIKLDPLSSLVLLCRC